ncbi:MAG TPA: OmpH family outer membrane protein [Pseudacidobacterium sp.]|jgi:outer membrane protein|nr:OmpH family outer membrane protein [Pseudacidobacterium sp.]
MLQAINCLRQAERESREQALESKEKQLQRDSEDYQNDSQSESQEVFRSVAAKVYAFLHDYAQQHGYTFVERGSKDNPIIWYAANSVDTTTAIVQAYNAKSGIAAPAKPTAPALKN